MVKESYVYAVLQGMSDLLSPILFVMGDESEAFWCFVALMERLGPNFNRDQNGMHSQLFALSKVFLLFSLSLSLSLSLSSLSNKQHTRILNLFFIEFVIYLLVDLHLACLSDLTLTLYYFNTYTQAHFAFIL